MSFFVSSVFYSFFPDLATIIYNIIYFLSCSIYLRPIVYMGAEIYPPWSFIRMNIRDLVFSYVV